MNKQHIGTKLLKVWNKCQKLPYGSIIFSKILAHFVPYTGTIKAQVEVFEKSHVIIKLKPRRIIFNHLNSTHAIALANLGEMATGLALITASPANSKAILVAFKIEYLKKARGILTTEATVELPEFTEDIESIVTTQIIDSEGDAVANIAATWRLRMIND